MATMLKVLSSVRNNCAKRRVLISSKNASKSFTLYMSRRTLIATIKHNNKKEKPLSSTSIIVQDGISILEMPCIVQVINGEFEITSNGKTENGDPYEGLGVECHAPKTLLKKINFQEDTEMALGFMRCNSIQEVFNLLNTCPEEEITPPVALAVIRRIFDLENNNQYRNQGSSMFSEDSNFTFTRTALIKRLLEIICTNSEPQVIVDTLRSMGRDPNTGDKGNYMEQICTESIILATDGKLSVAQVCDVIKAFHNLGDIGKEYIDKVWVGVNEKRREIDVDELCNIMGILPLVKNSRMYLYNIAERKLPLVWHKLTPEHIIRIVYTLVQLKLPSNRLLSLISRWTNLNIHNLTEGNLRWIIYTFLTLEYTDKNIQQAVSRYMKAKNTNIKSNTLVSVILNYCRKLRIRHPVILHFGADYFVHHCNEIPASEISVVLKCFGNLSYLPEDHQQFFHNLEKRIDDSFSQIPANDLIDIFLSCIYLKRYPLNFVKKVFHPYFFDRLYSQDEKQIAGNKEKLLILDTALTIECSSYRGPFLPWNYVSNDIRRDARVLRCINKIRPILLDIITNENILSQSVILPSLPPVSLFVVDCIIDITSKFNLNFNISRNKYALCILLPEHFDLSEKVLFGPQALKKRIIEHFNFKFVGLSYETINKLIIYPNKLKEYLLTEISKASKL